MPQFSEILYKIIHGMFLLNLSSLVESYFSILSVNHILSQGISQLHLTLEQSAKYKLFSSIPSAKPSLILSNSYLSICICHLLLNWLKEKRKSHLN